MLCRSDFCILYVDDDENDIRLVEFASEPAGVRDGIRTVRSGPQAIDYFQGHGPFVDRGKFPLPQVVLLDLRMPRMNGLEVLEWLRAQPELRGIVVIVFSSSVHPDDVVRASNLGANAFVQKPSTHIDLIRLLELIKGFWGGFHQFLPVQRNSVLGELANPNLKP